MFSFRLLVRQTAVAAALATAGAVVPAHALTIATGSYANTAIGAEFASPYDNFYITGATITMAAPTTPVVVALAEFSFEVGPNCWSCTLTPSFDALIDVTVDGITQQLDLPYSWYSSGPTDFLRFATPAPVVFDFASLGLVTIAIESVGTLSSSGNTVHGSVNALVATTPVPEPASYALMLAGFGVIAFVARRRSR
jgi:hypothetical protein